MDYVEKKASSVEKAIDLALSELGISREEAEIEILSEGKLLSKAVVRVCRRGTEINVAPQIDEELVQEAKNKTVKSKAKTEEAAQRAYEFVKGLISTMNLSCEAELIYNGDDITINVTGKDSSALIGYRGDTLDAVQYLTLLVANKGESGFIRVVVDAENYRNKRAQTLATLAVNLAEKAERLGRRIELEPMNPFERRAIHAALSDSEKAHTESSGEEPNRYVVIIPVNETPNAEPERYRDRRDSSRRDSRSSRRGSNKSSARRDNYRPKASNEYDPYAPSEEYKEKTSSKFSKTGPGKLRSFGYKKRI